MKTFEMPIKLSEVGFDHLADIQTLLSKLGLYPVSEIDGIYGEKTRQAWAKFKQSQFLADYDLISLLSYQKLHDLAHQKIVKTVVDWHDPNCKVSQYFTVNDVTKGDPRRIPTDPQIQKNILRLAKELDRIREAWGGPYRCDFLVSSPGRQSAAKGASNSQHITGKAADVYPVGGDLHKFQEWLDKTAWADKALGYGARKGFVHLDLRPGRIRWNY